MSTAALPDVEKQTLRCMEIWGGNQAFENAISVPGIDAWIFSQPYGDSETGGDIHYVSTCGAGKLSRFVVADVSGHGDSVGQLSARLRSLLRRHMNTLDQTRFVRDLNQEFSALAAEGMFATALLATYFAPTDHLIICNAGHPAPLWFRTEERSWQRLEHDVPQRVERLSNLPLGVIEPTNYYQFAVPLEKDDLVLIYTDSLTEARSPQGKPLGGQGLLEMVRQIDVRKPGELWRSLLERVAEYRNYAPAEDDITVLLLHHNGAAPPRQSFAEMVRVVGKMLHLVKV